MEYEKKLLVKNGKNRRNNLSNYGMTLYIFSNNVVLVWWTIVKEPAKQ